MPRRSVVSLTGLVLGIAMLVPASPASAAGQVDLLDPSFGGGDGIVTTGFTTSHGVPLADRGAAVAVQSDGKVLVAGTAGSAFAVVRFDADGTRDGTFGTGGKATKWFAGNPRASAMALRPDGKILVVGTAGDLSVFALARFNADGTPDPTFGKGGRVTTLVSSTQAAEARAVALQSDGKIVVAGWAQFGSSQDFALVRYDVDGALDPTFGTGGISGDAFVNDAEANAVAVQPDGKIVAAGVRGLDFVIVRYDGGGTLDPSFGGDGKVATSFGPAPCGPNYQGATSVAVQADLKIVAAGYANGPCDSAFAMARYGTDGTLDVAFGDQGRVETRDTEFQLSANGIALRPGGGIVLAGTATSGTPPIVWSWATASYTSAGAPDRTFSGDGLVLTPLSRMRARQEAAAVALQPDGDVVVAGTVPAHHGDMAALRYAPPAFRPDAKLRQYGVVGNDEYAADASKQTMRVFQPHRHGSGRLMVENDGTAADRYVIGGCDSSPLFKVAYSVGDHPVTKAVTDGTYRTSLLDPGATRVVKVTFVARPGATIGARISCALHVRSLNASVRVDAARLIFELLPRGCRLARPRGLASCA